VSQNIYLYKNTSLNNKLVLETYKKEALRSKVENGFAKLDQKSTVKGLRVLMDAKLADGTFITKDSTAYIKEETLHTQAWAQKSFESGALEGHFLIADLSYVEFVVPPAECRLADSESTE